MLSVSQLMKNPGLVYSQVFTGFLPFFKSQNNTHIIKIRQKKYIYKQFWHLPLYTIVCHFPWLSTCSFHLQPIHQYFSPSSSTQTQCHPTVISMGKLTVPGSLHTAISTARARREGKIWGFKETIENCFRRWLSNTHCLHSCSVHACSRSREITQPRMTESPLAEEAVWRRNYRARTGFFLGTGPLPRQGSGMKGLDLWNLPED